MPWTRLADLRPRPQYLIADATHPKKRERFGRVLPGDARRARREVLVELEIVFDDTYRDLPSLMGLIRSADLVVLPYDSYR